MLGIDVGDSWAWDLAYSLLPRASARQQEGGIWGWGKAAGIIPIQSSGHLLRKEQRGLRAEGKWAEQPGGGEAALVLSSEARQCPHDPDLRPTGYQQRKHKGGWAQGHKGSVRFSFTVPPCS